MIRQRKGIIFIESELLQLTDEYKVIEPDVTKINQSSVEIILPDFVPQFNTPEFKNRLNLFLQSSLPIQITYAVHFVNAIQLAKIIPVFCNWYNALIYNYKEESTDLQNNQIAINTTALNNLITEIYADEKK
jgi:hypothetical protein